MLSVNSNLTGCQLPQLLQTGYRSRRGMNGWTSNFRWELMSWSCVFDSLSINICQSASAASVNVTARCSSTRLTLKTTSTANDRSHRWLRCTLCNSLTIKGYDRCKFLSQDPNQPAWARAGRTPQVKVICILLQIKSYSMWKKKWKKKKKAWASGWHMLWLLCKCVLSLSTAEPDKTQAAVTAMLVLLPEQGSVTFPTLCVWRK